MDMLEFFAGDGSGYGSGYGRWSRNGSGYGFVCDDSFGDGKGYGSGYCSGYGSGYCSGYGSGYGSGDGSFGDGKGYGSGSGDGSGYGRGIGIGSGSGDGSGYGSGDGSSNGYSYGIVKLYGDKVYYVDGIPCIPLSVHANWAIVRVILKQDYTTKQAFIARIGGYYAHGDTIREAFAACEGKRLAAMNWEDRVAKFRDKFPDIDAVYNNADFFTWHNTITGSCEYGRKHFAEGKGISLDGSMTLRAFFELTKDEYGGDKIREVMSMYEVI